MSSTPAPSTIVSNAVTAATSQLLASFEAQMRADMASKIESLVEEAAAANRERENAETLLKLAQEKIKQLEQSVNVDVQQQHKELIALYDAKLDTAIASKDAVISELKAEIDFLSDRSQCWQAKFVQSESEKVQLKRGVEEKQYALAIQSASQPTASAKRGHPQTLEALEAPNPAQLPPSTVVAQGAPLENAGFQSRMSLAKSRQEKGEDDSDSDCEIVDENGLPLSQPSRESCYRLASDAPLRKRKRHSSFSTAPDHGCHSRLRSALKIHSLSLEDIKIKDNRFFCPIEGCSHVAVGHSGNLARHLTALIHNPHVYMCLAVSCFKIQTEAALSTHFLRLKNKSHRAEHDRAIKRGYSPCVRKEGVGALRKELELLALKDSAAPNGGFIDA